MQEQLSGEVFCIFSPGNILHISFRSARSAEESAKEGFFTFLTRDDAMFLVVEEKEKILGYCGLLMVLDEGDITNVAVRRDRQKEGIGAFLMQSLIRLAAEREVTTIHLEVRVGNETAIRLYERMGFTGDGIRKAYYSDPVEDALLMTRHPE